jgi:glycerol-3-phosphate dehydrogenase
MIHDLFVIGGGVNGCGIARDAAGRGLRVFLAEQGDLASGTSSASTKLIHGGLRYLEHYEFRLVREALIEREVLLKAAPHIIWPLRFVLPHHAGLRPRPVLRLGLFLYDHLGGRKILPPTRSVNLRSDETGKPLKEEYTHGYEYSDCWVRTHAWWSSTRETRPQRAPRSERGRSARLRGGSTAPGNSRYGPKAGWKNR